MQVHKCFYERNLPHYQPPEATFFITYRLFGSIPIPKINELKAEQVQLLQNIQNKSQDESLDLYANYFLKFDSELDRSLNEPYWLKEDAITEIISASLHFNHAKEYFLWCYTIMPNHVHALLTLNEKSKPLYSILRRHKRFTARHCNIILKRNGKFWQNESYDHVVRNDKSFNRIVSYISNNPIKAGFVDNWKDWKWSYVSPEL